MREVDIIGEVYVRIAGRDEDDKVSLDGFMIVNVTIKLPVHQRKRLMVRTDFEIVPCSWQLEFNEGSVRLTAEHVCICEIDDCPWWDTVTISLILDHVSWEDVPELKMDVSCYTYGRYI